jgi:hypothetical protein
MVRSEKPIATSLLNKLKFNLKENGRLVKNEYLPHSPREIWEKRDDAEKRKPHRKRNYCPTLLTLNLLTIK